MTTRRALVALACMAMLPPLGASSGAEEVSKLAEERLLSLGLFAGYVVACGLASEDQAAQMLGKLKAGLGELSPKETAELESARRMGRQTKCSEGPLRKAVERGWANYNNARFTPEPRSAPKAAQPPWSGDAAQPRVPPEAAPSRGP